MVFGTIQSQGSQINDSDSIHFETYGIKPVYRFKDPRTGNNLTAFTVKDEREIVFRLKELHIYKVTDSLGTVKYQEALSETKSLREAVNKSNSMIANRDEVIHNKDTIISNKDRAIEIADEEKKVMKRSRNKWVGIAIGELSVIIIAAVLWLS